MGWLVKITNSDPLFRWTHFLNCSRISRISWVNLRAFHDRTSVLILIANHPDICELIGWHIKEHVLKPKVKPAGLEPEKDATFFLSAPEISVFVACCVMVNELRGLERAVHAGDIIDGAYAQKSRAVLDRLSEAVEATHRFDIVQPVMQSGRFSPFFWRWFNWWDDYLKALTPSQVAETERRTRERGSLIEDLRPKGHWLTYRKTPAIALQSEPDAA